MQQFWRWRASAGSWALFQQALLGHLLSRLGPGGGYWDVGRGKTPAVGVSERPAGPKRPYTVLSTVDLNVQRMPVVEQTGDGSRKAGPGSSSRWLEPRRGGCPHFPAGWRSFHGVR